MSETAATAATADHVIGFLYCLTNESMPDIVKIGMTLHDTPEERANELSRVTGVPTPFCVAISKRIVNPRAKEMAVHELLTTLGFRVNERREFFRCSLHLVGLLFQVIDGWDVTISNADTLPVVKRQFMKVEMLE